MHNKLVTHYLLLLWEMNEHQFSRVKVVRLLLTRFSVSKRRLQNIIRLLLR